MPLVESLVGQTRHTLLLLFAAAGLVLVVAAANVGSLMLGMATQRREELAIRISLGAGPSDLWSRFLSESLILACLGGLAGCVSAWAALGVVLRMAGSALPRAEAIGVDGRVLGFAVVATVLVGAVCGSIPWLRTARVDLRPMLDRARAVSAPPRWSLRGALVVVQVAVSVFLLVAAGLLGRSLQRLSAVDPGLDVSRLLTFELDLPATAYPELEAVNSFYDHLLERLRGLPGVVDAASINLLPLSGGFDCSSVWAEDAPVPDHADRVCPQIRFIDERYPRVVRLALDRGRGFAALDRAPESSAVLINQTLAAMLWPGREALGRRLEVYHRSSEVVGVVRDVKHLSLAEAAPPRVYLPRGRPGEAWWYRGTTLVVRTQGDPLALAPAVRESIWQMDDRLPIASIRTMEDVVRGSFADSRFRTLLGASFAAVALALAGVGIYSAISFAVAQRRREMALRMALEASPSAVRGMLVRRGLMLVALGLGLGLGAALGTRRLLSGLLFEVSARDPVAFVLLPIGVGLLGWLASALPARRLTAADPLEALRAD